VFRRGNQCDRSFFNGGLFSPSFGPSRLPAGRPRRLHHPVAYLVFSWFFSNVLLVLLDTSALQAFDLKYIHAHSLYPVCEHRDLRV
jgi:hypothetical protein